MKYLVIGSGGREHALAWRLMSDGSASEVYVAPGNGGIEDSYRADIRVDDFHGIAKFARDKKIDLVVVGPEAPLAAGLVDHLEENGIRTFGPTRKAAQLEGSKLFAKYIMEKYNIPTCRHWEFNGKKELLEHINGVTDYPIVIKLDGLAAGKGVGLPENRDEAMDFINRMVEDDSNVFVEEHLSGEEASILGISDGETIKSMVSAQDHKRIYDGDRGPNTGGMGSYAPAPVMTPERLKRVHETIMKPTIEGMKKEGIPFKGVLYAGLMISGDDINVLEFNVRFGDPEIQAVLPLLNGRFGDILMAAVEGNLHNTDLSFKEKHAISVVISSGGYPLDYEKGKEIRGLDSINKDLIVFHAGTKRENGKIYTNGGRVLNVTGMGESIRAARDFVYGEIDKISFDGAFHRKDIAYRALR
jgi:phosphoribosylamine---glycine ligase